MCVPAKHALAFFCARIMDCSAGHLIRQQQPASVHSIQKARNTFCARVYLLDLQEDPFAQSTDRQVFLDEAIELVPMHGQVPLALVLPHIPLVHRNADQMRHQVGEAGIVIAFDPDDFHLAFWVRKLANKREELPVFAGQATKVEIGKYIAQQYQSSIAIRLQYVQRILRPAHFGPEVNIRQNQRVVRRPNHARVMQHS